jgi:phage regulator Rha-like protein
MIETLVYLEPNRLDSEPFTTSEVVAECTATKHHTVTRLIQQYEEDLAMFGKVRYKNEPLEGSVTGQSTKSYRLNEPQATLLITYMKNAPIVRAFKKELVRQFFLMRKELTKRVLEREKLKPARHDLTDAIKATNPKPWTYKQWMDMCYIVGLGNTAKKLREERGAEERANATDYLTADEIATVNKLTEKAALLLECGFAYKEAKDALLRAAKLKEMIFRDGTRVQRTHDAGANENRVGDRC